MQIQILLKVFKYFKILLYFDVMSYTSHNYPTFSVTILFQYFIFTNEHSRQLFISDQLLTACTD